MNVIDISNILIRGTALAVLTVLKVQEHSQGDIVIRTDGEPDYGVIVEYNGKEVYNSKIEFLDESEEFDNAWREWVKRMNSMMFEVHGLTLDELVVAGLCGETSE
jgi:hypothetical protein